MALGSGGGAGSRPTSSCHPRRPEAHQRPMSCSPVRHHSIQYVGGIGALDRSRFLALSLAFECLVSL
jgi:hypothetical protein